MSSWLPPNSLIESPRGFPLVKLSAASHLPMKSALRSLLFPLIAVAALASAALAQDPIKIGEFASLTGGNASFGKASNNGTKLAIEELNAAGGVLGRRL